MTQLQTQRFKQAEYERAVYTIIPEMDTPMDAILQPGYWAHVASRLKPWDIIEVRGEDGSYFAELLVQSAGKLFANVALLRSVDLKQKAAPGSIDTIPPGYDVKYQGPLLKWSVLRGSDRIKDGLDMEVQARTWLNEHISATALGKTKIPVAMAQMTEATKSAVATGAATGKQTPAAAGAETL
jgi:hypothetical protein